MPELPEVESVLRSLRDAPVSLIGRSVYETRILRDGVIEGDREQFTRAMTGAVFQEIVRHGKYLFFRFTPYCATSSGWMVLHLRMTGRLFLVPAEQAQERHTRLCLLLDRGLALRFDDPRAFGRAGLLEHPRSVTRRLGPDGLTIRHDELLRRLTVQRRQLKPLLLDQGFVAGVGNIYADELLFRARLHPLRSADSLCPDERERLCRALTAVLHQAVEAKGANIDGVFEAGRFPVAVYGRGGLPCPVCGTAIRRERLAGRGTHYCPACQRLA
ncbi:DNA-formamidopyrimidine glycosylase [Trichlorobacter ammonificans]|uniref:Formamidopyrimidine-DNA glycosylase n=1 Tax=Trichlorobacter ammonificans TaxID=2916410 RepID=A0ABN8HFM4_9BACT|nr:DNA-formamidopyrimidine glycosylase [Trichlorobacter ammonificans]CAH2031623.1 DNA-(apurinic or apyrimidinic site) lyase MutM [Trichlorobacter ammonificans]